MSIRLFTVIIVFIASMGWAQAADIAILNGQVIDGTNSPQYQADVLIEDGRITFIGDLDEKNLKAKKVIDATGRWITPGFIDLHPHGNPLVAKSFNNFLSQGVTTVVLGQDGRSPMVEQVRYVVLYPEWKAASEGKPTEYKGPVTLKQWMEALDKKGVEVNIIPTSGHGTNRLVAMALETDMTDEQIDRTEEILRADMEAGAWGISSGLEYVPGRYATLEELLYLAKIVGEYDGVIFSHIRSEDQDKIGAAIDEAVAQGQYARIGVSHLKVVYGKSIEDAEMVLGKIRQARNKGIEIIADTYPYLAGYACMTLVYPSWAKRREEWNDAVLNRREELEDALRKRVIKRNGPEAILIASGKYTGKTLKEVAEQLEMPFEKVLIDEFGFCGPGAAHRIMREDIQEKFIAAPDVAISTDGGPWINHPRSWGSYPKVLDEYTLRKKLMSVELAIHKMTGLPANFLRLPDRGILKKGNIADVLLIDPRKVKSNATWTKANQVASGFDAVIVNGILASKEGQVVCSKAGKVLRRPGTKSQEKQDAL